MNAKRVKMLKEDMETVLGKERLESSTILHKFLLKYKKAYALEFVLYPETNICMLDYPHFLTICKNYDVDILINPYADSLKIVVRIE